MLWRLVSGAVNVHDVSTMLGHFPMESEGPTTRLGTKAIEITRLLTYHSDGSLYNGGSRSSGTVVMSEN